MTDLRNNTSIKPRGLRNNNPGNLIITDILWQGKVKPAYHTNAPYEQFESVEYGTRAHLMDILNDIQKGKTTIEKLLYEYAPPSQNDTEAYIREVTRAVSFPRAETIPMTKAFIQKLSMAILAVENGQAFPSKYWLKGFDLLPGYRKDLVDTSIPLSQTFDVTKIMTGGTDTLQSATVKIEQLQEARTSYKTSGGGSGSGGFGGFGFALLFGLGAAMFVGLSDQGKKKAKR